ncbi:hypothetical protein [Parageobacillus sp. KH3-4]|uniref:hypothetical protein n=1 Tax=Parageobacillus sp. KH3-4 TaxID=2916802 RepID=UPI001FCC67D1|nr:hypothetical protein [Parageobacillus sp. KH3-4]BDG48762.1 hypothetical protein PspKH34_33230 [Parageobacillus sp. KH3-4]
MGIQWAKPVSSGGTDLLKITPFTQFTQIATSTSWKTVFSITGKGLLSTIKSAPYSNNYYAILRVTVDGTVIFDAQIVANGSYRYVGGIMQKDDVFFTSSGGMYMTTVGSSTYPIDPSIIKSQYPYINEEYPALILLDFPIPFNESVLVEIKQGLTNSTFFNEIRGGLLP